MDVATDLDTSGGSDHEFFDNVDIDDPVLNHSTPAGVRYNANRCLFVESSDPATDMDVRAPLRNVTNSCISTQPCSSSSIVEELKKVTSRLDTLSEHMESLGGRMKSLEQTQTAFSTLCSSSDGSAVKGNRKVPAKVSVRICLYFSVFLSCYYAAVNVMPHPPCWG